MIPIIIFVAPEFRHRMAHMHSRTQNANDNNCDFLGFVPNCAYTELDHNKPEKDVRLNLNSDLPKN